MIVQRGGNKVFPERGDEKPNQARSARAVTVIMRWYLVPVTVSSHVAESFQPAEITTVPGRAMDGDAVEAGLVFDGVRGHEQGALRSIISSIHGTG